MATRNNKKVVEPKASDTVQDPCMAAIDRAAESTVSVRECADMLATHCANWALVDRRKCKTPAAIKKHASDLKVTSNQIQMVCMWLVRMGEAWKLHNAERINASPKFAGKADKAKAAIAAGVFAFQQSIRLQSPEYVLQNAGSRSKAAKKARVQSKKAAPAKAAQPAKPVGPTVKGIIQYLAGFTAPCRDLIAARKKAGLGVNALNNALQLVQTALDGMHGMK